MKRRFTPILLGELPRKTITWLWRNWIPAGFLVLVEGEEEAGKGYFLVWCLVQAASGAWGPPMPGLYLSSEEEPEMIQERLLAAGYKPGIYAPIHTLRVTDCTDDGTELETIIRLPEDMEAVIAFVKYHGIQVVATDLLRDHSAPLVELGIRQRSNNDETWIRPAARAWGKLAYRTGAVVLGSHHRNKREDGSARSKSSGSGGWRQVARVVITLAHVGEQRAIALDKNNLTQYSKVPWEFDIERVTDEAGCFVWGDELTDFRNIDHWEAEMRKGPVLEIVPAAVLEQWCLGSMNGQVELRLPSQDLLEGRTGLSQKKLRLALADLRAQGRVVTRHEKRIRGMGQDWYLKP